MMNRSERISSETLRGKDLIFQAISWHAQDVAIEDDGGDDEQGEQDVKYMIKMFGSDAKGRTVSVTVTDFTPFFYVKVPDNWTDDTHSKPFERMLKDKLGKLKSGLMPVKILPKKDFWGFTNFREFQFARLCFTSHRAMRRAVWILNQPITYNSLGLRNHTFKQYESNIDPFLRFIHLQDLMPTGWMRLPAGTFRSTDILSSTCQIDVEVNWRKVKPYACEDTAPFLIASFDLECMSDTGDFPVAINKQFRKVAADIYEAYHDVITRKYQPSDYFDAVLACLTKPFTDKLAPQSPTHPYALALERMNFFYAKDESYDRRLVTDKLKKFAVDDILLLLGGKIPGAEKREEIVNRINAKLNKLLAVDVKARGDAIIQVGTTFHHYGDRECSKRVIITYGTCQPIENVEVIACSTEEELLIEWHKLIAETNPDIITGYNIFGFDFEYLINRADDLGLVHKRREKVDGRDQTVYHGDFMKLGRLTEIPSKYEIKMLSSSALGDNELKFIDMPGRVLIDMMKVIQRDHKLDSYKLDAVATHFMKMAKHDVSPQDIFRLQKGTDADRKVIAEYCIQDCALCNHLIMKLEIVANNMGMSNVCLVPLSYIFMRGQGIKIFSLVLKQCKDENFVIPVVRPARSADGELEENPDDVGYEGAIVLEPKEGIYINQPISVLDYASLYPSSMISENLSHDCIVIDPAYDNLPGVEYLPITYDIYEGVGDKKTKVGERVCKYVQLPNNEKGIVPRILQKLLKARKTTRKKAEWQVLRTTNGKEYTGFVDKDNDNYIVKCVGDHEGETVTIPISDTASVEDAYNDFQKAVLDGLQLAYKVTANSLYGQIGARTSPIYLKDIAACTTATGRKMIMMAKEYIEKNYLGAEIVYGDSVTGDTAILVRYPDGHIDIKTIETLTSNWINLDKFRPWDDEITQKEQGFIDAEVWSNGKWAKIKRIIRHKTNKRIFHINTLEGAACVTEDHSLLDTNLNKIAPKDCEVNKTKLLHSFPNEFPEVDILLAEQGRPFGNTGVMKRCSRCEQDYDETFFYLARTPKKTGIPIRDKRCKLCVKEVNCIRRDKEFDGKMKDKVLQYYTPPRTITKFEAWVWGIFFGDGSCGHYECPSGRKYSWAINNANMKYLDIARKYLRGCEPSEIVPDFEMLDTLASSGVYKLVPTGSLKYMVEKYRALMYDKDDHKKVPSIILNAPYEVRYWFMKGYLAADGTKGKDFVDSPGLYGTGIKGGRWNFACKGQIGAQGLYYLMKSLGWKDIRVNTNWHKKPNTYWINDIKKDESVRKNLLLKKIELPRTHDFVYDIETDNNIFQCAVGSMNLANTDSIMVSFKSKDEMGNVLTGLDALRKGRELGMEVSKNFKKIIKAPHDLEWEKIFDPFILLSKKRYVGNKYEHDDYKFKQTSMGIVLKRRDNAPIVKKIYGGAIDKILNDKDIHKSIEFVKAELEKLVNGEAPLEDLIISKSLRANYADPTKIAHKVLAERIGDRDPGNRPQINDRIPYVYVEQPPPDPNIPKCRQPKILQGERIEHPSYIREHNLKPDYGFYITNQIMKPLLQLYAIVADQLGLRSKAEYETFYNEKLAETGSETKAKDKLDALREKDVQKFLFDPFLDRILPPKPKRAAKKTAAPKKTDPIDATAIAEAVEQCAPKKPRGKKKEAAEEQPSREQQEPTPEKKPRARKPKAIPIDIPNPFDEQIPQAPVTMPDPEITPPKRRVVRKTAPPTQEAPAAPAPTKRQVTKKPPPPQPVEEPAQPKPRRMIRKVPQETI